MARDTRRQCYSRCSPIQAVPSQTRTDVIVSQGRS